MKIIVGLGNPGDKYMYTRHNLGFLFIDYLKNKNNFEDFKYETKFKGDISYGNISGEKVILLKPQTFMNLSGESLKKLTMFYKLDKSDFIVIYDDISMDFGKIRFRNKGSAGGHNGIKDIIRYFGEEWNRIKVGIGFDDKFEISDFVLSKFKEEELIDLENKIFLEIYEIIKSKYE